MRGFVQLSFILAAMIVATVYAESPIPADPPAIVVKKLGKPVIEMLRQAESVEAFRVGAADKENGTLETTVGLRKISGEAKPMTREYMERLLAAFMLEKTFNQQDSKGTKAAVGYRFKIKGGGRVELSYCLNKGNVLLAAYDAQGTLVKKGDVSGFRNDPQAPLRFLAAEAFPDDAEIKKYTPAKVAPDKP